MSFICVAIIVSMATVLYWGNGKSDASLSILGRGLSRPVTGGRDRHAHKIRVRRDRDGIADFRDRQLHRLATVVRILMSQ